MKTATVRARLEPALKKKAEKVLEHVGLSTTAAITLFYHQVILHRGLPFPVRVPNRTTQRTLARTDHGEDMTTYPSAEAMFEDLDI